MQGLNIRGSFDKCKTVSELRKRIDLGGYLITTD